MRTILLCLLMAANAIAEDIYIAQSNKGSANGTSAANARAMTWFNTASNWNTTAGADGKIGPGDIVHFTGIITSTANIQGSGISGKRITLRIDPGAKFSSPVWPVSGAIEGQNKSFITVEGSNPKAGDGVVVQTDIENTNNGTALGTQTAQSRHVYFDGSGTDITVRNLVSKNVYVRTYNSPTDLAGGGSNVSVRGGRNILVENCYMDNSESGVVIGGTAPLSENLYIDNCWIMNVANGAKVATVAPGNIIQNCGIVRCRMDYLSRWGNAGAGGGYHNDGIQTIADPAGSQIRDFHVAYNHMGPHFSEPGDQSMTSVIFIAQNVTKSYVYNNFIELAAGNVCTNPVIQVGNQPVEQGLSTGEAHLVANNTVIGGGVSYGMHLGYGLSVGNIISNMKGYCDFHNAPAANPALNTKANNNIYFGSTDPGGAFRIRSGPNTGEGGFSWWQNAGFDPQGATVDPKLNPDGTLKDGSPAIGFAPKQTVFNDDFFGNPRTVPWDAGAFKYTGTGPQPTPTPPQPTPTPQPTPEPPAVSFSLSWGAVANATSYRVYENGNRIADITETIFPLAGKVGPLNYQVTAINASGESVKSNQVTLPAPPSPTPSPSPTATPLPTPAPPILQLIQEQRFSS